MLALKNGLIYENGELVYYNNGVAGYAGVIQVDGAIYCIGYGGKALKGELIIHREMTNGIIKRGTYTFGEDYKLIPDSYIAPRSEQHKEGKNGIKNKKLKRFLRYWRRLKRKKEIIATIVIIVLVIALIQFAGKHQNGVKLREKLSIGKDTNTTVSTTPSETVAEKETVAVTPTEKETVPEETVTATPTEQETVAEETVSVIGNTKVTLPQYVGDVLLCSEAAKMEYDGKITLKEAVAAGEPYRPFVFEYSLQNCSGTLWLGEKKDLSDAKQYALPESQRSIEIHNLKVNIDYYYKVQVADQEYLGNFHTALSTRYFYIPGLENVRDLGGGTTLDGKRVKQGLLIRGVEMDGLSTVEYFIPDDKLEEAKLLCDFVYDMDLRAKRVYLGEFTSRLEIPHKFYYAPQYGETFNTGFRSALKKVFSDMAKPENYPMYVHCTWGRDRTGTIMYLLQGVLNMSEEDMVQDYLRSSYWFKKMATSEDLRVINAGLEPYYGDTLQEKIVTFLITEIGVTEEEIASIRSILLEKAN